MRKLETQPTDLDMKPRDPAGDGTVDIEADTVEEAMARVAATLGEDAQIIDARKTVSGGIAGLFAKERVVLTARRPEGGISSILDQMSRDVDAAETEFGEMLRRRLATAEVVATVPNDTTFADVAPAETTSEPVAVGAILAADAEGYSLTPIDSPLVEPAPLATAAHSLAPRLDPIPTPAPTAAPAPAPTPSSTVSAVPAVPAGSETSLPPHMPPAEAPPGAGVVDWGRTELVRHGVPERVVAAVAGIDPADDLAWIKGIADAVAPMCGGPLGEDGIVVGAAAARVGDLMDLDGVDPCSIAPYRGGFFTPVEGTGEEQKWLEFVLADRPLHVVIDDSKAWGDLLVADPSVVSWIDDSGVAVALHLAATLGARLGFCPSARPGELVRATPVDVALAVRQLVRRK